MKLCEIYNDLDAAVRQARKTKDALAKKKGRKPTKKTTTVVKRGYVVEKTKIPKPAGGVRMEHWGVSSEWLATNGDEADFADDETDKHPAPDWTAQGKGIKETAEERGSSSDNSQSDSSNDSGSDSD
jgi:hypothetical protein